MRIGFLRHGPTDWNAEKRLQGRADIPLSAAGRAQAGRYRLPVDFRGVRAFVSPLSRARETAELAGIAAFSEESQLIEMDWGRWEGERLATLRERFGLEMEANEQRGLDFRPEGGESPREVQARLIEFFGRLNRLEPRPECCLAVSHKGVIRAALALAYGWDMTGKPPVRLDWSALHVVRLGPDGALEPDVMNVSLLP
ncbi:histidine phosphatase family protein [Nisaea acidiphila]|uniref:Histidine phosphatase family protein n=1 Tax=Nisaea acidiphila TaxID=1862145 RepID=A0A9J7AM23_9PROT|nr:histidine phosphatase family protein [Nisaea acidiphila]UUX48010.1 histidine phosphatase family protein [Nisaea acidiphila]